MQKNAREKRLTTTTLQWLDTLNASPECPEENEGFTVMQFQPDQGKNHKKSPLAAEVKRCEMMAPQHFPNQKSLYC
jgi:hypothetical protein